jgi:hypothetical protein
MPLTAADFEREPLLPDPSWTEEVVAAAAVSSCVTWAEADLWPAPPCPASLLSSCSRGRSCPYPHLEELRNSGSGPMVPFATLLR